MDDHSAGYDFVQLGEGLAKTLLKAAHEQVNKANQILEQTQSLADIIMTQVKSQASQIEDMNARFKSFGEQMLVAHRVLNGSDPAGRTGGSEKVPDRTLGGDNDLRHAAPSSDLAMLRALGDLKRGHNSPDGPPGGPHNIGDGTANVGRGAPDPARQASGLPRAMADLDRFRVNRADQRAGRNDPRDPRDDGGVFGTSLGVTGTDDSRAS